MLQYFVYFSFLIENQTVVGKTILFNLLYCILSKKVLFGCSYRKNDRQIIQGLTPIPHTEEKLFCKKNKFEIFAD